MSKQFYKPINFRSDSRFREYQKLHGDESWELDALSPKFLAGLVEKFTRTYIDGERWEARKQEIADIKARLHKVAKNFK